MKFNKHMFKISKNKSTSGKWQRARGSFTIYKFFAHKQSCLPSPTGDHNWVNPLLVSQMHFFRLPVKNFFPVVINRKWSNISLEFTRRHHVKTKIYARRYLSNQPRLPTFHIMRLQAPAGVSKQKTSLPTPHYLNIPSSDWIK